LCPTGSAGFDLYGDDGTVSQYIGTYIPPFGIQNGYHSVIELGSGTFRDITILFSLYSDVLELIIGISDTAVLTVPTPYRDMKPIVHYGSSITQGGCTSRPGNAYQNIITRSNLVDHINLGFSGSAKAEKAIYEHIKELEMSLFVYDYDYNAPNSEHLANTHEKMFRAIRQRHPSLPITMLSRPKVYLDAKEQPRLEIIETTYRNAIAAGDRNVYFIKGPDLMAETHNEGTVDGIHPNDYGFHSIARVLGAQINKTLAL